MPLSDGAGEVAAIGEGVTRVKIGDRGESRAAEGLGCSEVINYIETPDWDAKVRELTDGRGVDCVVEIGGPETVAMSLQALGHVSLIGASLTPCRYWDRQRVRRSG